MLSSPLCTGATSCFVLQQQRVCGGDVQWRLGTESLQLAPQQGGEAAAAQSWCVQRLLVSHLAEAAGMPAQRKVGHGVRCHWAGSAPGSPRALAKQAALIQILAPASTPASAQPTLAAPAGDAPSTSGQSEVYTDMMWRSPSPQGYVAPVIDMQQVGRLAPFLRPYGPRHGTAQRGNAMQTRRGWNTQPCMMELPWHHVMSMAARLLACSSSCLPCTSVCCLPANTRWPSGSIR